MTTYAVTLDTWNDPAFWAAISESAAGHRLDFSALPDGFGVEFDQANLVLFLNYAGETFMVGDARAPAAFDAQLGAATEWAFFSDVTGGAGSDTLGGGAGADTLDGGAGGDSLLGGAGDDVIHGGPGDDTVYAGEGADTVIGGAGDDFIAGNEGDDWIEGGAGSDSLYGQYGDDYVSGGDGDDTLEGNEGNDTLIGGPGNDWMRGSYGNDELWGGTGDDYYWGGWGDDTFHIENDFGNDTIDAEGVDEVLGDTLDLSAVTDALRIDLSHISPEIGSVTDGTSTLIYDEIETIVLGSGIDTLLLAGGGHDAVTGFVAPSDMGDGSYVGNDLLDVSELTDDTGAPVDTADVTVTDTAGDGSGDAVLGFPGGVSLTLVGVLASQVASAGQLEALGIPAATVEETTADPESAPPDADDSEAVDETGGGTQETEEGAAVALPQIDGAFEFAATIRFDDITDARDQRVFEFGGAGEDRITFGQLGPSSAVLFEIIQDGITALIVAEDAIIEGETAHWAIGVDAAGYMYVEKDGVQIAEGDGVVPADSLRTHNLLGGSEAQSLHGEISGISLTQQLSVWSPEAGTTDTAREGGASDLGSESEDAAEDAPGVPGVPDDTLPQIGGAFEFSATLRFDDLTEARGQQVFEFGGAGEDRIAFGQLGPSNAVVFSVSQGGSTHYVVAEEALTEGETADWTVGVDDSGFMYVEKDGTQIAEGDGVVPLDSDRLSNLLGGAAESALRGEISGVSVTQAGSIWTLDDTGEAHLSLTGTEAAEFLQGGAGADTLFGGGGDDTLAGGEGADVFALGAVAGDVTIADFSDEDRIDLSQISAWDDGAALMAALTQEDGTARLSFDIDGDSQTLAIETEEELDEDDFLL